MKTMRIVALRVLVIVGAFAISLAVAGSIFAAVIGIASGKPLSEPGNGLADLAGSLALSAGIVAVTAGMIVAIPVALLAALAEWRRWRGAMRHTVLGGLIGFGATALWLHATVASMPSDYLAGTLAGIAGALVYWWIAGRNAGRWREALQ